MQRKKQLKKYLEKEKNMQQMRSSKFGEKHGQLCYKIGI